MTLVAFAADKGSPGVTTSCLALALVWPRRVVVAECDPAGGDLALRLRRPDGLPPNPDVGILSLAATARLGMGADEIWTHVQRLALGVDVLVGLGTAEQGSGLEHLRKAVAHALHAVDGADIFADLGRIGPATPSAEFLAETDRVVLVTRASADAMWRLRERLLALDDVLRWSTSDGTPVSVLVVGSPRRPQVVAEIAEILRRSGFRVDVLGLIAADKDAAAVLRGEPGPRLNRTLLWRSAREVADRLAAQTIRDAVAPAAADVGQPAVRPHRSAPPPEIGQPATPPYPPARTAGGRRG